MRVRHRVRDRAVALGFDLVAQTKLVTATSELARNTVLHGGGGNMTLEQVEQGGRTGIRLTFRDEGPGISDLDRALQDGWSSGSGLGLGLSGSRRLVSEFDVRSTPGEGTTVTVLLWKGRL